MGLLSWLFGSGKEKDEFAGLRPLLEQVSGLGLEALIDQPPAERAALDRRLKAAGDLLSELSRCCQALREGFQAELRSGLVSLYDEQDQKRQAKIEKLEEAVSLLLPPVTRSRVALGDGSGEGPFAEGRDNDIKMGLSLVAELRPGLAAPGAEPSD